MKEVRNYAKAIIAHLQKKIEDPPIFTTKDMNTGYESALKEVIEEIQQDLDKGIL